MTVQPGAGVDATFQGVLHHEVEAAQVRQLVAFHRADGAVIQAAGHPLAGQFTGQPGIVLGGEGKHRHAQGVALVAGTGVGVIAQQYLGHQNHSSRCRTAVRSMRNVVVPRDSPMCRRTPPPPAGPLV